ncbi:MAG: hypothetical protein WD229_13425, partial [Pirellulales bacterium]
MPMPTPARRTVNLKLSRRTGLMLRRLIEPTLEWMLRREVERMPMQGRTAMWHALGQAVQPIRWDSVAATVFTDPEVATVGMSPEEAVAAGMTVATAKLDFRRNPRAK